MPRVRWNLLRVEQIRLHLDDVASITLGVQLEVLRLIRTLPGLRLRAVEILLLLCGEVHAASEGSGPLACAIVRRPGVANTEHLMQGVSRRLVRLLKCRFH